VLVQLLFFPGCPNVGAARGTLERALSKVHDPLPIQEVDVTDPATPPDLRAWGSPTILINGVDVAGADPAGSCCRLYRTSERRGAPSLAIVEAALLRAGLGRVR